MGGGSWAGDFNFSTDTNNPLDTNYGYANALLGNFNELHRDDGFADVQRPAPIGGVLRPGHLEADAAT